MKGIVLYILITHLNIGLTQNILKKQVEKIAPVSPFSFLVAGNSMAIANTIRIEQMDVLLEIDFTKEKWEEIKGSVQLIFTSFESLNFLKDETINKQYGGLCKMGKTLFSDIVIIMGELFQFKNENKEDIQINACSVTPLSMLKAEWNKILENATVQSIILEYCGYTSDFGIVYENKASNMLATLDELTDGIYPEVLLGNAVRNCNFAKNGEGEKFTVSRCMFSKRGTRCEIQISQATNLRKYIQQHPVHYNGIGLSGTTHNDIIARTAEMLDLKFLQCDNDLWGDFMVCEEFPVPENCRKGLDMENVEIITEYCNFTHRNPQIGTILPNGGILIQSIDPVEIMSNITKIGQYPPIVVYTPETLTIKHRDEEYSFAPAIKIEELIIVESKLTEDDLKLLYSVFYWNEGMINIDLDFWFDVALLIIELLVIPIAIAGLVLAIKQKNDIKDLTNSLFGRRKRMCKENFKRNRRQLLELSKIGKMYTTYDLSKGTPQ